MTEVEEVESQVEEPEMSEVCEADLRNCDALLLCVL